MYRIARLGCVALIIGALSTSHVSAKAFEPEFTITKIEGAVKVQSPGASRFSDAEAGSSYKYGTVIKTKRRSTAVVQFSQGNTCRITARTTVTITESTANENLKVMKLDVGHVLEIGDNEFEEVDIKPGYSLTVKVVYGMKSLINQTQTFYANGTIGSHPQ